MVNEISKEAVENFLKSGYLSCKHVHDHACLSSALSRLLSNFTKNAKLFIPLYFLPTLISKRKQLKTNGSEILKGTLLSCLQTLAFVSTWFALWKYSLCKTKDIRMTVDSIFLNSY